MKLPSLLTGCIFIVATAVLAQNSAPAELSLKLLPNEVWWGGATALGSKMPFGTTPIAVNLDGENYGNQAAPLLLSSQGPYIWGDKAFAFSVEGNELRVSSPGHVIRHGQAGSNLRTAYAFASAHF